MDESYDEKTDPKKNQEQKLVTQGNDQTSPVVREVPIIFRGTPGEYFKIWIVNVCLSIVTLGIYSAWAKVRTKRYFYGNTSLDGVSFDYDADPVKILKGRLIIGALFGAMAISQHILLPVYFVLLGLLFLALPWLIIKALSFNARYSSFRNVRFAFVGKLGEAYKIFVGLPLLTVLTLGLLHPYVKRQQVSYVMNSHRYGVRPFRFETSLSKFWAIYGVVFGVVIVMSIAMVVAVVTSISPKDLANLAAGAADAGANASPTQSPDLTVVWILYGCLYFVALFLLAFLNANLTNITWNNTQLGEHTFKSAQTTWGLFGLYITNLLMVVLTLGMTIPFALIRMADYRARCMTVNVVGGLDVMASDIQAEISAAGDAALDLGDFGIDLGI